MSFTKVVILGVSSEVGKTTLLCQLLREFPGWEAIKMTRGHYRSCGKDPHACCVSRLLGDEPLVRSGFQQTYSSDKDTGRYWDAGAKVYLFNRALDGTEATSPRESLELLNSKFGPGGLKRSLYPKQAARLGTPVLPAYAASDFPKLLERINQIHSLDCEVAKATRVQGETS